jgi:hypothetical protein
VKKMFYKSVGYGGYTNPLLLGNAGICFLFKDSQQVAHTLNCDISLSTNPLAQACPTFFDKGPLPLRWIGSRAM